jgi:hypothetical protein
LAPVVVALLSAQLALLWIQGGLLHRQHQEIRDLREDIQSLAESIDAMQGVEMGNEGDYAPSSTGLRSHGRRPKILRVRHLQETPASTPQTDEERARKDLEASRVSAQKAVSEAREVQSKLSIEENARRAEEKAKIERAQNAWQKWIWLALATGFLAYVIRAWLRRRD